MFGDELSKSVQEFGALPAEHSRSAWQQFVDCDPIVWESSIAMKYRCTRFKCSTRTDGLVHGADILRQVKTFLLVGPVIFAVKMNAAFMTLGSGIWYPDENNIAGIGHFVCAVFDDTDANCIHFINSFGPEWGQGGYGKISYRAFEVLAASDAWSFARMEG